VIEFDQSQEDSQEVENDGKDLQSESSEEVAAETDHDAQEINLEENTGEPKDELSSLKDELVAVNDKHLRLAAEYQNYRKRTIQDFTRKLEQGRSDVALAVLPVLDDLRRSLETTEEDSDDSFVQGVRLVFDKFNNELSKYQIKKMEVMNEMFVETHHEALQFIPAPEGVEEGTIMAEVQPGYMMGERVLRHAQVIIAKAVESEEPKIAEDKAEEEKPNEDEAVNE